VNRIRIAFALVALALAGCEYCDTATEYLQDRCLDGDQGSCEVLQKNAPAPWCQ
jgi:hypothetical protein